MNDNNTSPSERWQPSDLVPGISATDEIAPHQLAYMLSERKKMLDAFAAKLAVLKNDFVASVSSNPPGPANAQGKSATANT
jgi:hypothetical protein